MLRDEQLHSLLVDIAAMRLQDVPFSEQNSQGRRKSVKEHLTHTLPSSRPQEILKSASLDDRSQFFAFTGYSSLYSGATQDPVLLLHLSGLGFQLVLRSS